MKLSDAIQGFWLTRRRSLSEDTRRNYGGRFKQFVKFIGDPEFLAIDSKDIRAALNNEHDRGVSDRTVYDMWVALSALWTWANAELNVPHAIRGHIPMPSFQKPAIVPFTENEIKAMIRAAEWSASWNSTLNKPTRSKRSTAKRDRAIILTLLDTGLRSSEMCALQCQDYNQDQGRLFVRHGKGDKQRYVYMGERTQKAIWLYNLERSIKADDPLFMTKTRNRIDRNNLRHTLQAIAAVAGVEDVYPHRFRHTFAINFLRNGGNVFELQRILGHEELDTVKVYLSIAQVDIATAQRTHSPADNWRL